MSRKRKSKSISEIAADLAAARRKAFEAVNLSAEAAGLIRNADIEVTRAGEQRAEQKVQTDTARRVDAIEEVRSLLRKAECAGCYDALRRMEYDMLVRRGEGDRGRALERVDGDGGKDLADKMIDAAERIDGIEGRLSRRDWKLVRELIQPTQSHGGWRGLVRFVTGEDNDQAQAGAFRGACANLRDAYEGWDLEQSGRARKAA